MKFNLNLSGENVHFVIRSSSCHRWRVVFVRVDNMNGMTCIFILHICMTDISLKTVRSVYVKVKVTEADRWIKGTAHWTFFFLLDRWWWSVASSTRLNEYGAVRLLFQMSFESVHTERGGGRGRNKKFTEKITNVNIWPAISHCQSMPSQPNRHPSVCRSVCAFLSILQSFFNISFQISSSLPPFPPPPLISPSSSLSVYVCLCVFFPLCRLVYELERAIFPS